MSQKRFPRSVITRLWLMVILCGTISVVNGCRPNSPALPTPPARQDATPSLPVMSTLVWQGITPGKTTLTEVVSLLGDPHEQTRRGDYQIYTYKNLGYLGPSGRWHETEIWAQVQAMSTTVMAVYRSDPYTKATDTGYISRADIASVGDLVNIYGKPDKVAWTYIVNLRYLIWARYGIAAEVNVNMWRRRWNELHVFEVILFEPMTLSEFLQTQSQWPWPHQVSEIGTENLYPVGSSDHPDALPEDPFDWNNILLPTATP